MASVGSGDTRTDTRCGGVRGASGGIPARPIVDSRRRRNAGLVCFGLDRQWTRSRTDCDYRDGWLTIARLIVTFLKSSPGTPTGSLKKIEDHDQRGRRENPRPPRKFWLRVGKAPKGEPRRKTTLHQDPAGQSQKRARCSTEDTPLNRTRPSAAGRRNIGARTIFRSYAKKVKGSNITMATFSGGENNDGNPDAPLYHSLVLLEH